MAWKITTDLGFGYLQDDVYAKATEPVVDYDKETISFMVMYYLNEESRLSEKETEEAQAILADPVKVAELTDEEKNKYNWIAGMRIRKPKQERFIITNVDYSILTDKTKVYETVYEFLVNSVAEFADAVKC